MYKILSANAHDQHEQTIPAPTHLFPKCDLYERIDIAFNQAMETIMENCGEIDDEVGAVIITKMGLLEIRNDISKLQDTKLKGDLLLLFYNKLDLLFKKMRSSILLILDNCGAVDSGEFEMYTYSLALYYTFLEIFPDHRDLAFDKYLLFGLVKLLEVVICYAPEYDDELIDYFEEFFIDYESGEFYCQTIEDEFPLTQIIRLYLLNSEDFEVKDILIMNELVANHSLL